MSKPNKKCELCLIRNAESTNFKGLWVCKICRRNEEKNLKLDKCKDL